MKICPIFLQKVPENSLTEEMTITTKDRLF